MVAADFQTILAALTLIERGPNGRFPPRREAQAGVAAAAHRVHCE